MQYNFQHSPYTQERMIGDFLSITSPGRIGLPKRFLARYSIQRGVRAILYWDAESRTLAIAFTGEADPAAHPVGFTQKYGAFINAARFFRHHQLNPSKFVGRYPYTVSAGPDVGIATNETVFLMSLKKRLASEQGEEAHATDVD